MQRFQILSGGSIESGDASHERKMGTRGEIRCSLFPEWVEDEYSCIQSLEKFRIECKSTNPSCLSAMDVRGTGISVLRSKALWMKRLRIEIKVTRDIQYMPCTIDSLYSSNI